MLMLATQRDILDPGRHLEAHYVDIILYLYIFGMAQELT